MRDTNQQQAQQQLMNDISDTEKKLTDLKQQLQHQEKHFGKTQFYIERYEAGYDSDNFDTTFSQLDLRRENKRKMLRAEEKNVKTLSFKIEELELHNEDLRALLNDEKKKRKHEKAWLSPQIDKLQLENDLLRKEQGETKNEMAKLRFKNKDLQKLLTEDEKNVKTFSFQIEELQLDNRDLRERLIDEEEKMKNEEANLLLQIDKLQLENDLLRKEQGETKNEMAKLRFKNKDLQKLLTEDEKNVKTFSFQIEELQLDNRDLRERLIDVEEKMKNEEANLLLQIDKLQVENEDLCKMLRKEQEERVKEVIKLRLKIRDLNEKMIEEAKNIETFSIQIEELQLNNGGLREMLKDEKDIKKNEEAKFLSQIDKLHFESEDLRKLLRKNQEKRKKEVEELRLKIEDMHGQLNEKAKIVQTLRVMLKDEVEERKNEEKKLLSQIEDLQIENDEQRTIVKKEKEESEKEVTKLRLNNNDLQKMLKKKQKEREDEVAELRLKIKKVYEMLTEETKKVKTFSIQIEELELDNNNVCEMLREEKQRSKMAEAKSDTLRLENENLRGILAEEKKKREIEEEKNFRTLLQIENLRELMTEEKVKREQETKKVSTFLIQIENLQHKNKTLCKVLTEEKKKRKSNARKLDKLRLENKHLREMLAVEQAKREKELSQNISTLLPEIENQLENQTLCAELSEKKEKIGKEEAKNENLFPRGDRLVENNPAISQLSVPNRPRKLGEYHSELYDNEWTKALESMHAKGYDEENAISMLLVTFIKVLDFCKQKAENMLVKTEDAINFVFEDCRLIHTTRPALFKYNEKFADINLHEEWRNASEEEQESPELPVKMSDAIENKITALRKETAELMVPVVEKAYMKAALRNGELVPALKPYIRKCIFLCWMMVVQSPPMCVLEVEMKENLKFDKNYFNEYTSSGPVVKYFVWPALLLHENGPVVCKGVAQGCRTSRTMLQ